MALEGVDFWKMPEFKKALFVEYTTNFDCGYDTGWWYCIKEGPYIFDDLKPKRKKNIRRSLRNVAVRREDIASCLDELYEVYSKAEAGYENSDNEVNETEFRNGYLKMTQRKDQELWTGRDVETNKLIGYMLCTVHDYYVETNVAKYEPEYMSLGVSNAINHTILEEYINHQGKKYVDSGSRSINHKTNSMDYKIDTFDYRKVFCKLHLKYRPIFKVMVILLYPLRNQLLKLDNYTLVHQANAVLAMEEIRREYSIKL